MSMLFRTKPLEAIMGDAVETGEHTLRRTLGATNLITLGIGAIIGTGIFVLTGVVASGYSGPGVVFTFIIAAICCVFAGLCYAEFAAMIPVAGSAYTYGYATLGEIFAWIIGWDLVLEYDFGAATVCSGWSGYVLSLGQDFGLRLPPALAGNAYADSDHPRVPATLARARELFAGSAVAREAFGPAVVDHYLNAADVELRAFESTVTDWERVRGFERL